MKAGIIRKELNSLLPKPYYQTKLGKLYHGDCLDILENIVSIDLVVTSPPYNNLRHYNGYDFNFFNIAKFLFNNTKDGGIIVWIVNDQTINGSKTGTSFKQVLYFKDLGFNLHDVMIWNKGGFSAVGSLATRYAPVFEYMFVLSKGKIKTFNPIKDRKTKNAGRCVYGTIRNIDGSTKPMSKKIIVNEYSQRFNIWECYPCRQSGSDKHPAPFPLSLAKDHIVSWSNKNDIVLDPFLGSGTTAVACEQLNRRWIGVEISEKYCEMSAKRIEFSLKQKTKSSMKKLRKVKV